MIEFREFDRNDWMSFAGCENGPNGEPPLIAETEFDGFDTIVVADANGVCICMVQQDGDEYIDRNYTWNHDNALPYAANVLFAKGITDFSHDALTALGFFEV
ncbi:hypothetical protein AAY80_113 [Stenotrophomonas phage vB_SmaS-DLP_6]|nr:hypothetical protein AAY80_113 [Stenotrophomonas phage vB_SmaS-DLP_6]